MVSQPVVNASRTNIADTTRQALPPGLSPRLFLAVTTVNLPYIPFKRRYR